MEPLHSGRGEASIAKTDTCTRHHAEGEIEHQNRRSKT
ncbi:Uncharacterised protein [Vibrio cholerae]|nr:Uncharacterised protein [Vibrio cholerae]